MDVSAFLNQVKRSPHYEGQIVHDEALPGRGASFGELDAPLDDCLREALRRAGIHRFYSHQAAAVNAARRGDHVITVTSTASGKTMCYNVPVLDDLLANPLHRALYIFPTKALAQDQLGKLAAMRLPGLRSATYDGDTPREDRRALKTRASIILTNPDMLQVSILPYHSTWSGFLRNLRWVVIDEVHTYRGVFGSHVANVLRRLRRVCAHYGANPQFLFSSATIANPDELVRRLAGVEATLVDEDGSPSGPKRFVFWNPPPIGSGDAGRRSTNMETTGLFSALMEEGVRTIAFAKARQTAEIILRYARNVLQKQGDGLESKVTSYRAGYRAADRREIERRLFNGDLLGVVSTNALELGVDIGGLDACILNGFPGTIASTWQQAGRAGRGSAGSLAILVAQDNPLDQYLMGRPNWFFGRAHEHALVDPDNLHILRGHIRAAAYELPLTDDDTRFFGLGMALAAKELEEAGELRRAGDCLAYAGSRYPAGDLNIRSAFGDAFNVEVTPGGEVIGTVPIENVQFTIHPGAIYLHMGDSYIVEDLDVPRKTAFVRRTDVNYYTQPRESNAVDIRRQESSKRVARTEAFFGDVNVTNMVLGYRRKQHYSDSVLSVVDLDMPPITFETEGVWFVAPGWAAERLAEDGVDIGAGLHAIEHAAIGLTPLWAMCDRNDIGGVSYSRHPELQLPAVFIHDAHPGGVGISERCFEILEPLLRATREHIAACPCTSGCPSCIQSPKCGNNNEHLDKDAALIILDMLL
ncbi:MAG TPA: DEAD/DEAH box helicase [Armatimonadota bacterium]